MDKNSSFISIIIPCRDEDKFIGKCLDSILAQDYPKDRMEILVVDGMSVDKTETIVHGYVQRYPFIRLVKNERQITPAAFNLGIKQSKGGVIIIMGAHSNYASDYVSRCVKSLFEYNADNVGGMAAVLPARNSLIAKAIAFSLSSHFGSGNAAYKMARSKTVKEVDTVFGGCYKRNVFDRIGLFNEALQRTQDIEFNTRLKKSGGKIILDPSIVSYYYARPDLKSFWSMNFNSGMWVIYSRKFTKTRYKLRQYVPVIFVSVVVAILVLAIPVPLIRPFLWTILGLYLLAILFWSLTISFKEKNILYLAVMPVVFFVRHFAYGIGSLAGAFKLAIAPQKP